MWLISFIFLTLISLISQPIYGAEFMYHTSSRNSFFNGREEELSEVYDIFRLHKMTNVVSLVGLPGIGKSALAQEFSWKNKDKFDIILKLECTGDIRSQLIDFGRFWNQK